MNEFWGFLKDVKSIEGWLVKLGTGAPLLPLLAGWVPPWPSAAAVSVASALAQGCVLIGVFTLFAKKSKRIIKRYLIASFVFLFVSAVGYVVAFANLTELDSYERRHVIGTQMAHPDYIASQYPGNLPRALFERGPAKIYKPMNLALCRAGLLLSWELVWMTLCFVVGLFVAISPSTRN